MSLDDVGLFMWQVASTYVWWETLESPSHNYSTTLIDWLPEVRTDQCLSGLVEIW